MSGQHGGLRSGAGRKPSPEKVKSRPLKTLDAEWDQIQVNAEKAGIPVNAWLRQFGTDDNILAVYQMAVKAYENGELNEFKGECIGQLSKLIANINK